jgi:hypothetical protein
MKLQNSPKLLLDYSVLKLPTNLKKGCDDGKWMELSQDRVRWRALVLAVSNLRDSTAFFGNFQENHKHFWT